jgi:hypothetical protein
MLRFQQVVIVTLLVLTPLKVAVVVHHTAKSTVALVAVIPEMAVVLVVQAGLAVAALLLLPAVGQADTPVLVALAKAVIQPILLDPEAVAAVVLPWAVTQDATHRAVAVERDKAVKEPMVLHQQASLALVVAGVPVAGQVHKVPMDLIQPWQATEAITEVVLAVQLVQPTQEKVLDKPQPVQ